MEKIESGTLELHIRDFVLASAIQQSIESVRMIAEQAGVTMENHSTGEPIHVCGDEQKTTQILIGLLASILKNSVPGKTVSLVSKKLDQFAEIEVADAGLAIPSSLAREIVDQSPRFERGGGKNASTGLSLALCKALVEAQGGKFSFTSTADSANVFSFRLPLVRSNNSSVS
jgi:signal transduction histidine kinase